MKKDNTNYEILRFIDRFHKIYRKKKYARKYKYGFMYGVTGCTEEFLLENGNIYSILRLDNNNIYTVGDLISDINSDDIKIIKSFNIKNGNIWVNYEENKGGDWLVNVEKLINPSVIMDDGVEIFNADGFYWIRNWSECSYKSFCSIWGNTLTPYTFKFSTKEEAENWVEKNKKLN